MYLSSPAIAGQTVFCSPGDFDPYVYALDLNSGRTLWASAGSQADVVAKRRAADAVDAKLVRRFLHSSPERRTQMIRQLGSHGIDVSVLEHLSALYAGGLSKRQATRPTDFVPDGLDVKTSSVAVDAANVYVINREPGYPLPRFSMNALDRSSGKAAWKSKFTELRNCLPIGYCFLARCGRELGIFRLGRRKSICVVRGQRRGAMAGFPFRRHRCLTGNNG